MDNPLVGVASPKLRDSTVERLRACLRPRRLTSTDGQFDIGYERAKQDILDVLNNELRPTHTDHALEKAAGSNRSLLSRLLRQ